MTDHTSRVPRISTVGHPGAGQCHAAARVSAAGAPSSEHLVGGGGVQERHGDRTPHDSAAIDEIIMLHRQRRAIVDTERAVTLRVKAMCRQICGGDKTEANRVFREISRHGVDQENAEDETVRIAWLATVPLRRMRRAIHQERLDADLALSRAAMGLPVWSWCEAIRGLGAVGLGQIVGEAGDLACYATPARLWKRLGLAVLDGERQRKHANAAKALEHGYSPRRRSVVWVIGDSLIKQQNGYRELYLRQKERYAAERPGWSKAHIHLAAKRYMEKRLLRDLWRAWRQVEQ